MAGRETLTPAEFDFIRGLIRDYAGIVIGENKRSMVQGRITRRMRELGIRDVGEYLDYIRTAPEIERDGLASALTTNVTAFFREIHHFEYLTTQFLPSLRGRGLRRIRAWSAGCSSGEEAYSIAITLMEGLGDEKGWDIGVLATDLDFNMIRFAREGVYPLERVGRLPPEQLKRWFLRGGGSQDGRVMVRPELKRIVRVMPLNLLEEWPMSGPFDVIFCRNVFIYFDRDVKARIVDRYAELLPVGGLLFIGHSESLHGLTDRFELIGGTIYRKKQ
ncbi:CheR family methyltransferase [Wenzhouxiangella limi]|uniref:Chemotaxis protein methyltransferase n=1 Tax=Wenzhouxiangella limi TaxID=2707351 RepID=A0A845UV13_9GAMM|nr:protein-glutamate O-methyltransferase [Wenzhouxiangella limi]NDY95337.1 protein-glutamate O-methyltransferase [Wenzhouxiangella limi]